MKSFTAFSGIARWALRITILLVVFTRYYEDFMAFQLDSFEFYVAAVFIIFGVLLLIGGFLSKHDITVVSGLLLVIASIIMGFVSFDGITGEFALNLLLGSAALLFVTEGNK